MHEMSQLDIPDRQLRTTSAHPRVSISREIGEATITHTIFGKAKVRIVRKHDRFRRGLELIVLVLLAVAAWQMWLASQANAPLPSPDSPSSVSASARQPETISPPATAPAESTPGQSEAGKPGPAIAAPIAP